MQNLQNNPYGDCLIAIEMAKISHFLFGKTYIEIVLKKCKILLDEGLAE